MHYAHCTAAGNLGNWWRPGFWFFQLLWAEWDLNDFDGGLQLFFWEEEATAISFENVLHGKCLLFENKTWCFVQSMVPQPANAIKSFKLRFLCCVQQVNLNHCAFQFNAFIQHITIVHSTRCINKMHCCTYLSWYCNKNSNQARDFLCQKDAMACKSSIIWDDNATFHEMQLGS